MGIFCLHVFAYLISPSFFADSSQAGLCVKFTFWGHVPFLVLIIPLYEESDPISHAHGSCTTQTREACLTIQFKYSLLRGQVYFL